MYISNIEHVQNISVSKTWYTTCARPTQTKTVHLIKPFCIIINFQGNHINGLETNGIFAKPNIWTSTSTTRTIHCLCSSKHVMFSLYKIRIGHIYYHLMYFLKQITKKSQLVSYKYIRLPKIGWSEFKDDVNHFW